MCHRNNPDSGTGNSSSRNNQVVSLCEHRKKRAIECSTDRLIEHLEAIHREAIAVHNRIIDRVELSVLTELCRTTGLILDRIPDELLASVVIPAALYGDSRGDIFGKKPLQQHILDTVSDSRARDLLRQLQCGHPAVWELLPEDEVPTKSVVPLAGPCQGEPVSVAAIICREGRCSEKPGVYTGWELHFDDHRFVVFGHPLKRRREVAVRDLLASRDDRHTPEIWRRAQLSLLGAIIDPDQRHQRPGAHSHRQAIRRPPSRRALVLAIRRALWRHFADSREGLTIHAHIAALVDDRDAYQAFLEEVSEIADAVTIKFGGLSPKEAPIELDELLRPFFAGEDGHLAPPPSLKRHPLAVLLLEEPICAALGVQDHQPIEAALRWAREHPSTTASRAVELAWMTYSTEQNLAATYGFGLARVPAPDTEPALPCARLSPVLPNLRTLFDPRFVEHTLADLDLCSADRRRLDSALEREDLAIDKFRLADLERDERQLTRLHGVSHSTCNAVRRALLRLASHWRWKKCGLDPRLATRLESSTKQDLLEGLDLLAEFFDN